MSDFCSALYLSAFSTFATIQAVEAFDLTWANVEYFKAGSVMVYSSQHVSAPMKAMMSSMFIGSGLFLKRYDMWEDETIIRYGTVESKILLHSNGTPIDSLSHPEGVYDKSSLYGNAALVGLTVFDALWIRPVLTDVLISVLKH